MLLHELPQIYWHVFEDEVHAAWRTANVQQLHNMQVVRRFQKGNLTNGGVWDAFVVILGPHSLDSYSLQCLLAAGTENRTICAFDVHFIVQNVLSQHAACLIAIPVLFMQRGLH